MTITRHMTGGGCTAYLVTEPDAKGFYALVTDEDGSRIPVAPETEKMLIGAYHQEQDGETLSLIEVEGRAGLINWYKEHVGYDPDEDIDGTTMMLELLDRVASHILLRHANEPKGEEA